MSAAADDLADSRGDGRSPRPDDEAAAGQRPPDRDDPAPSGGEAAARRTPAGTTPHDPDDTGDSHGVLPGTRGDGTPDGRGGSGPVRGETGSARGESASPQGPSTGESPTNRGGPDVPGPDRPGGPASPARGTPPPISGRRGPSWLKDEATIAGRLIVIGVAGLGVLWFISQVEVVVIAAFLGFAVTALLWPVARELRRFLPRVVASLLSVTSFLAAFLFLVWFISSEVVNSWAVLQGSVIGAIEDLDVWVRGLGISIPDELVENSLDQLQSRIGTLASGIGEAALTGLNVIGLMISGALVALFITIFALTSGDTLANDFVQAVPRGRRTSVACAIRSAFSAARWWLLASTVTGLVDGLFIGLGMHFLGLPLAIPIGVLTFVLGFIPMVGATLAGAIAVLIGIFFGGPLMGFWVLLLVLAVQQIEGNVLSPLLMSKAMQFHPIVTLLLTTAGGFTFGITGLFLAVPLAGVAAAAVRGWRMGLPDHAEPASA